MSDSKDKYYRQDIDIISFNEMKKLGDLIGINVIGMKPEEMSWHQYAHAIFKDIRELQPTKISLSYWNLYDPYIASLMKPIGYTTINNGLIDQSGQNMTTLVPIYDPASRSIAQAATQHIVNTSF